MTNRNEQQRRWRALRMRALRSAGIFLLSLLLLFVARDGAFAQSPMPEPSSAEELFQERPFGPYDPTTPTPRTRIINPDDDKPIPVGWYIGGAAAALLAIVGLFYGTARASRSSNLFDRQYHFPTGAEAALRFGATKSGGHMATIELDPSTQRRSLKAEDA